MPAYTRVVLMISTTHAYMHEIDPCPLPHGGSTVSRISYIINHHHRSHQLEATQDRHYIAIAITCRCTFQLNPPRRENKQSSSQARPWSLLEPIHCVYARIRVLESNLALARSASAGVGGLGSVCGLVYCRRRPVWLELVLVFFFRVNRPGRVLGRGRPSR